MRPRLSSFKEKKSLKGVCVAAPVYSLTQCHHFLGINTIICPWTQFPGNTHLEPIQVNFLCHYGHLAPASSGSLQRSINIRIMLATGKLSKGYVYTPSSSWDFTTLSKEPSAEATTVSLKAAGWVFLCHANRAEQIYSQGFLTRSKRSTLSESSTTIADDQKRPRK